MWPLAVSSSLNPRPRDTILSDISAGTYILKANDTLSLDAPNSDKYVAIQPHSFNGALEFLYTFPNGSRISSNCSHGQRFFAHDGNVTLKYRRFGAAEVSVWQIPHGICGNYAINAAHQREASINFEKASVSSPVCWLLTFAKSAEYFIDFKSEDALANVTIGCGSNIGDTTVKAYSTNFSIGGLLSSTSFIALSAAKRPTRLNVIMKANISYADWTDSPGFFTEMFRPIPDDEMPMFITSKRDVSTWIWISLTFIFASIFSSGFVLFFIRPAKEAAMCSEATDEAIETLIKSKGKTS